ncbi:hypothetical protein BS50DRAFT_339642 [Corynespora cassiicola Philippines]|uniref:Uncharacterized protein n=1 Tax=Corynespora cassiicola Philippines TaxID=1448308 RepID=A0A2T2NV57_CORCC|nr:hypothetical protein BS50DRAFT_339642 [Corynespora cassiicola Philippines]
MSTTSLTLPTGTQEQPRPSLVVRGPSEPSLPSGNKNDYFVHPLSPRASLSRHFGSLQEHADVVRAMTPNGGGSTPQPESRREGFIWDVPVGEEPREGDIASPKVLSNRPTPPTPPLLVQVTAVSQHPDPARESVASATSSSTFRSSRSSSKRRSTASSLTDALYRNDTSRSTASSIARGVRRHVPDLRIFKSSDGKSQKSEKQPRHNEEQSPRKSQDERHHKSSPQNSSPQTYLPPALKTILPSEKATKHVNIAEEPAYKVPPATRGGGLKDRRKIDRAEAMKLTLPLELPDLPSRRREVMYDAGNLVAPRRLSPKTPASENPLVMSANYPRSQDTEEGILPGNDTFISSSSPKSEKHHPKARERYHVSGPRLKKKNSGTAESDSSLAMTPDGNYSPAQLDFPSFDQRQLQTLAELKELGKTRRNHRSRWRWSGPWTSNDLAESPSSASSRPYFPFTRLLRSKYDNSDTPPSTSLQDKVAVEQCWGLKKRQSIPVRPHTLYEPSQLDSMPVPPNFIPPGLQRVPTPPIYDSHGDLKGKLAGFFFDLQGLRRPKESPTAAQGIWDSDTLLMPLDPRLSKKTSSDESPQGLSSLSPTPLDFEYAPMSGAGRSKAHVRYPSAPTPDAHGRADWFRLKLGEDTDADERAKNEWCTPEHLPGSPLCPLSDKYRGPSAGICVFHGRKSDATILEKGKGKDSGKEQQNVDGAEAGPGSWVCVGMGCSKRSLRRRLMSSSP